MKLTVDTQIEAAEIGTRAPPRETPWDPPAQGTEDRISAYVSELSRMTPEERIRASRYTMNRREYWTYVALYPNEVPLLNGELERITLTLE